MKILSWLGLLGLILWACNNSSSSNKATDSVGITGADSLRNDQSNTVNRMGDTSSYERMSQKITDSAIVQ